MILRTEVGKGLLTAQALRARQAQGSGTWAGLRANYGGVDRKAIETHGHTLTHLHLRALSTLPRLCAPVHTHNRTRKRLDPPLQGV